MPVDAPARVRLRPEPKPGGVRWLVRLDPETSASYAAAVAPLVPAVERTLAEGVVANRVREVATDPPAIRLEAWTGARARFRRLARDAAAGAGAALIADVRDCYGSIAPAAVVRALDDVGAAAEDAEPVLCLLERFRALGVRGLPIGPEPSAVLANAVLAEVDRAVALAGFVHVRWVDDVVVFARDDVGAVRALSVLEDALGAIGLRLAHEKSRVLLDPASVGRVPTALSGPVRRPGRPRG